MSPWIRLVLDDPAREAKTAFRQAGWKRFMDTQRHYVFREQVT